jgi:rubrerythrin
MNVKSILTKSHYMYELTPIIENWLLETGYVVTVLANRIDAEKENLVIRLYLEDYALGCSIKVYSNNQFFETLQEYLAENSFLTNVIACPYCGKPVQIPLAICPFCGAPIK